MGWRDYEEDTFNRHKRMKMKMIEDEEDEYYRVKERLKEAQRRLDTIRRENRKMEEEEETQIKTQLSQIPKIDIFFLIDGDQQVNWYSITNSHYCSYPSSGKKRVLEPVLPRFTEPIHAPTYALLGSKIYAAGGMLPPKDDGMDKDTVLKLKKLRIHLPVVHFRPPSNKVFYIDLLHLKEGWKAAPPMNASRVRPYMVADGGKMYVFGGLRLRHPEDPIDENRVFAEVYDPSNPDAGWKKLVCISDEKIELPQEINGHAIVEEHDGDLDRTILFHSYYSKSLHQLSTTRHEIADYDIKFGEHHTTSTFLDGVLFFLSFNRMYAYNVSTRSGKDKLVVLHGVEADTLPYRGESDESWPRAKLQSLGNWHLALVWAKAPEIGEFLDVHCSIIKISEDAEFFVGNVVSHSTYSVKRGWLKCCMAVPSAEEDVSLGAERGKYINRHYTNKISFGSSASSSLSSRRKRIEYRSEQEALPRYLLTNYEPHIGVDGRKRGVLRRREDELQKNVDMRTRYSLEEEDVRMAAEGRARNTKRADKQHWRGKRH